MQQGDRRLVGIMQQGDRHLVVLAGADVWEAGAIPQGGGRVAQGDRHPAGGLGSSGIQVGGTSR